MEVHGIRMEPPIGYLLILRVHVKNSFPEKYDRLLFDYGNSDHFEAALIKDGSDWFILIDKLKLLPQYEVQQIRDFQKSEFEKIGEKVKIEIADKVIKRTVFSLTSNFLTAMEKIKGVTIFGVVLLGHEDTLIGIEYPEISSDEVSALLSDYISDTNFDVDVLYLRKETDSEISPFLRFHDFAKFNYSNSILITTEWMMTNEELESENMGIFQNEMYVRLKSPNVNLTKLIAKFPKKSNDCAIKGNGKVSPVTEDMCTILAEVELTEGWYTSFRNHIATSVNYHLHYWGYSNGKGVMINNFVIPSYNERPFLKGLKSYFEEPVRIQHRNMVVNLWNFYDIARTYYSKISDRI